MVENKYLIIPDASVILKWALVDEVNGVTEALSLQDDVVRGKVKLLIPSHCLFEILNTLSRLMPDDVLTFVSYLVQYKLIEEVPATIELAQRALVLVKKYKVTFYDAAYHALALITKGTFVTADEKYYKQTKAEGNIRLL